MTTYKQASQVLDDQTTFEAVLHTSHGDVTVSINAQYAPQTANNFAFLAKENFWDNTIIHRVIPGFVVQMGDPTGTGTGGPGYQFEDELALARVEGYKRGTLAMANAGPDTNGSQFFICLQDVQLPPAYSVFGIVIGGMEAIDHIATLPTDMHDHPIDDAAILKSVSVTL